MELTWRDEVGRETTIAAVLELAHAAAFVGADPADDLERPSVVEHPNEYEPGEGVVGWADRKVAVDTDRPNLKPVAVLRTHSCRFPLNARMDELVKSQLAVGSLNMGLRAAIATVVEVWSQSSSNILVSPANPHGRSEGTFISGETDNDAHVYVPERFRNERFSLERIVGRDGRK